MHASVSRIIGVRVIENRQLLLHFFGIEQRLQVVPLIESLQNPRERAHVIPRRPIE